MKRKKKSVKGSIAPIVDYRSLMEAEAGTKLFQLATVIVFAMRQLTISPQPISFLQEVVAWVAIVSALAIQVRIYVPWWREQRGGPSMKLITGGLFRLSRNPMYELVAVWDFWRHIYHQPVTVNLVLTTASLYTSAMVACHYHEKEVLARFGKEAQAYYAKTPSSVLWWPFWPWIRPRSE